MRIDDEIIKIKMEHPNKLLYVVKSNNIYNCFFESDIHVKPLDWLGREFFPTRITNYFYNSYRLLFLGLFFSKTVSIKRKIIFFKGIIFLVVFSLVGI